jgi:hypothetical protein
MTAADRAVLAAAVLTFLQKRIKAEADAARLVVAEHLKKGDTLSARSPLDDVKIARVGKSDPKARASFSDQPAAEQWVTDRYPEKLVERTEIVGPMAEVLQVLRDHAPHLVADRKSVPDWALNELLVKAEQLGRPVGFGGELDEHAPPGIEVTVPEGVLTVVLDKANAESAIQALWDAHMVGMDGSVRQIEGAPQ